MRRLLATRTDRIVTTVTAVLLVAVGYLAGFWTAESRKEIPIVFQSSAEKSQDVLTPEDLEKLAAPTESPATDEARRPSVRSAQESNSAKPEQHSQGAAPTGALVASVNGTKYYFPDCTEVKRIKEENRISFASEAEARDQGYEPSACVKRQSGGR